MSRRLFEYLCEEGHLTERLTTYEVASISCETCGKSAFKQLSAPTIKLEPYSGIFVSAADKWARKRAEKLKQEQKQNQA